MNNICQTLDNANPILIFGVLIICYYGSILISKIIKKT